MQGRAQSFNGRLQFVIESIRRVMLGADSQDRREGFSEDELLPSAPRPLDEMWAELQQVVARLGNPHVRALAESLVRQRGAPAHLAGSPRRPSRLSWRASSSTS